VQISYVLTQCGQAGTIVRLQGTAQEIAWDGITRNVGRTTGPRFAEWLNAALYSPDPAKEENTALRPIWVLYMQLASR
jgi:hypothetical protein